MIADDETRHASLSWAAHAWLRDQLPEGARSELDAAMRAAFSELRAELDVDVPDDLVHTAGMPTRGQLRALVDALAGAGIRASNDLVVNHPLKPSCKGVRME